ncbi:MAG: hypothetical protein WC781_00145 [Candidatus Pacearchaeota archaeon]|jgi:hypothetical protein
MTNSEKLMSPNCGSIIEGGNLELIYREGKKDKVFLQFPKDSEGNDLIEKELYFDYLKPHESPSSLVLCKIIKANHGELTIQYEEGSVTLYHWRYAFDGPQHPVVETKEYWKNVQEESWKRVLNHASSLSPANEKNIKKTIERLQSRINWISSNLENKVNCSLVKQFT